MYKLTIEWNGNALPTWFIKAVADGRCERFYHQKKVDKSEFDTMVDNLMSDHPNLDRDIAVKFVSISYYV